jgi:hypothetical protein
VVRAAIGNRSVQDAKNMMDWANSAGIYVIIDNHSHNAHNETQPVQSFFNDVSAYVKQKNYTHVIYEIYNEPVCKYGNSTNCSNDQRTTWADLKPFAQSVISTIRANDADGLIIVGTPNFSSNIAAARQDPLTGTYAHNVLYTLHFYAGEDAHGVYRIALEGAYCNNFPVFVSEWGTSPANGNGTISTSNSNTWISLLEAAKVSWANWSIVDKNESSAALTSSNIDGGLTASGTYVKNLFKLNNTGTSLQSVGLTQQTINCYTPPPPTGPDGKISFGGNHSLANFASKNGADSSDGTIIALKNTSASFTADYIITKVPRAGTYIIGFSLASTANGTVSWSGSKVANGSLQIKSSGSLDKYESTETTTINIGEAPETPLRLTFTMPSANSLKAYSVRLFTASSEDSLTYGITTPVLPIKLANFSYWSYDAVAKSFVFEKSEGTLAIYNLRGEKIKSFIAQGRVSVNALPSGAYIAVYRRGGETSTKTIHLK